MTFAYELRGETFYDKAGYEDQVMQTSPVMYRVPAHPAYNHPYAMLPTPALGMHPRLPMAHHQVRFPVHPSAGHPRFHAVQRFQRFDYPPPAVVPQTYISPISSPTCLPSGLVSPAHSSPTVLSEGYVSPVTSLPEGYISPAASPTDALQEVPEESTSPSCSSSGSPALPLDTHAASSPALPLDMQFVRSPVPPLNMNAARSPALPLDMHPVRSPALPLDMHAIRSPVPPLDMHAVRSPVFPMGVHAVRSPVLPMDMHAIRSNIPLNMHAGSNATQPQFFSFPHPPPALPHYQHFHRPQIVRVTYYHPNQQFQTCAAGPLIQHQLM